jgi:glycosyltransferase involved in cell wall biosynthesis
VKILFVNLSAVKFTVETPYYSALGGSESSLCYLARELARSGHDVALTANLPDGQGGVIAGIGHYPVEVVRDVAFFIAEKFDIFIICNAPAAAAPLKALSPQSRILFWAHVLADQPSMQVLARGDAKDPIDTAVFVSAWQRDVVEGAFGKFRSSVVIGNGIGPAFENMFASPADVLRAKQNRAAYASTPYRGLSVLMRAMDGLERETRLDVFSSMKLYQASDADYVALFAQAAQNPAISCHGAVTQSELAQRLRECAFLFYPCIYPETFCISAAEALAAGMKVISTRLGALEETTMGHADLVPIISTSGEVLVQSYREAMRNAIDAFSANPTAWAEEKFAQAQQASRSYSWKARVTEWECLLAARD